MRLLAKAGPSPPAPVGHAKVHEVRKGRDRGSVLQKDTPRGCVEEEWGQGNGGLCSGQHSEMAPPLQGPHPI